MMEIYGKKGLESTVKRLPHGGKTSVFRMERGFRGKKYFPACVFRDII